MKMRPDYNKIEYCLGNGFELLSASTVFAVCQDSSDFSQHYIEDLLFTKFHVKTVLGTTWEKPEDASKPEKRNINET